jgi:hypothetical protein
LGVYLESQLPSDVGWKKSKNLVVIGNAQHKNTEPGRWDFCCVRIGICAFFLGRRGCKQWVSRGERLLHHASSQTSCVSATPGHPRSIPATLTANHTCSRPSGYTRTYTSPRRGAQDTPISRCTSHSATSRSASRCSPPPLLPTPSRSPASPRASTTSTMHSANPSTVPPLPAARPTTSCPTRAARPSVSRACLPLASWSRARARTSM